MLPVKFFRWAGLSALLCGLMLGCGDGGGSKPDGDNAKPESPPPSTEAAAPKDVDPASLPKLGPYLPPLDSGAVEAAPPDGWTPLPRKPEYLVRFFHEDKTQLPRIEITVAANPLSGFGDVTSDNVGEFAEEMKPVSTSKGRKVIEPCLPLTFGDSAWSRNVRLAKTSSGMGQIQSLQTIRGGKLYSVELLVEGSEVADLKKFKDYAYAVAAGMKFSGSGAAPAPAEETPALPTE